MGVVQTCIKRTLERSEEASTRGGLLFGGWAFMKLAAPPTLPQWQRGPWQPCRTLVSQASRIFLLPEIKKNTAGSRD